MGEDVKIRRRKLDEYQRDPHNPNKGSSRGKSILTKSLRERGAARSVVAASDDVFLAGNQTVDAARDVGITDVIEIETDGTALVVVKRRDLASGDEAARLLAYEDNRARDPAAWDADQIFADLDAGISLEHLFRMDELDDLKLDLDMGKEINSIVDRSVEGGDDATVPQRLAGMVREKQIKPVLYVRQLEVFERALRRAGIANRGDALVAVCQFYLEHHEQNEED